MRRDEDLIRELLLEYEQEEDWLLMTPGETSGASREERQKLGHLKLMMDQGLIAEVGRGTFRITASGYDFLEAIRSEGIWEKTKAAVAETGGNATLDIVKQLAVGFLKIKLSKHTGIELRYRPASPGSARTSPMGRALLQR